MKELDVEAAVSPSVSPYRVHRVSVDSSQRRNSDDSNVKNNMRQRIFTSKKFGASWSEQQIAAEKEVLLVEIRRYWISFLGLQSMLSFDGLSLCLKQAKVKTLF